jgi:hypothetical protein
MIPYIVSFSSGITYQKSRIAAKIQSKYIIIDNQANHDDYMISLPIRSHVDGSTGLDLGSRTNQNVVAIETNSNCLGLRSGRCRSHTHVSFTAPSLVRTPTVYPGLPMSAILHHGSSLSINFCPLHPQETEHLLLYHPLFSSTFSLVYLCVYYPPPPSLYTFHPVIILPFSLHAHTISAYFFYILPQLVRFHIDPSSQVLCLESFLSMIQHLIILIFQPRFIHHFQKDYNLTVKTH